MRELGKKHGALLEGIFAESDGWAAAAPVGSFPQGLSRWGIEDLVGNVWEWVADYYERYSDTDPENPTGPANGRTRATRGFHNAESIRSHGVGFRCAKTL